MDGDTGWEEGRRWHLKDIAGDKPDCNAEHQMGIASRARLRSLMGAGYNIVWTGSAGSYGRNLHIRLADGRDVRGVLIAEGLAQS